MKYIVMLGDGMADYPVRELDGKTPLEAAFKPNMDFIAQHGATGMVKTIPEGMPPGSDTANMSVMGYDPERYYSGRSPLEAVSLGIDLKADDVTFRCNLVTLSEEEPYENKTMVDYSAGEISTEEAKELIAALNQNIKADDMQLYCGISYRHCLVLNEGKTGTELTPPHDISLKPVAGHLPAGRYGDRLLSMMKRSYEVLKDHPVNRARRTAGKNPANSMWFWGEGTRPKFDSIASLYGVNGGVVCAVDLIKGLGLCAGMRTVDVEGATGGMVTNCKGKAEAALKLIDEGCDFVYIHVEAPDECGHHGDAAAKVAAIEAIDREMLAPIMEGMRERGENYAILLTPDHPTPVALRTHTGEAVPFAIYRSDAEGETNASGYSEREASETGLYLEKGPMLMERLIQKK